MPNPNGTDELNRLRRALLNGERDEVINTLLSQPTQLDKPQQFKKPILVLDFDGVLHSYVSGWQGADVANDDPVPGAIEFCQGAIEKFTLWVVSSRCGQDGGTNAIMKWLEKWHFPMGMYVSDNGSKPAAFLTLDDRAITFDGHWPDVDLMLQFQPWYKRGA